MLLQTFGFSLSSVDRSYTIHNDHHSGHRIDYSIQNPDGSSALQVGTENQQHRIMNTRTNTVSYLNAGRIQAMGVVMIVLTTFLMHSLQLLKLEEVRGLVSLN